MQNTEPKDVAKKSLVPTWLRVIIPLALIGVWLSIGSAGGMSFGEINDVATNDRADQLPESAESTKVAELQHRFRESNAIPAIVVFQRDDGLTDADDELVAELSRETNSLETVEGIWQPIVSEDEQAVEVTAPADPTTAVAPIVSALARRILQT